MSAKFGYNIRTLANNNFLKSLKTEILPPWESSKNYVKGDMVLSNGNKYIATSSGTSGITAPSHGKGDPAKDSNADNTGVFWIFSEAYSNDFPFIGNLYSFLGKSGPNNEWANPDNPDDPDLSDSGSTTALNDITSLRKIANENMRFGIKRHNWGARDGNKFSQYDPDKDPYASEGVTKYDLPFYCVNKDYQIFKCINNNHNASSIQEPSITAGSTSYSDLLNLGDGYVWKYMGELNPADLDNFKTEEFIPVEYKSYNDNTTSGQRQWTVQSAARNGQISTFKFLGAIGNAVVDPIVTIFTDILASQSELSPAGSAFVPVDYKNKILSALYGQVLVSNPGYNYTKNCIAIVREKNAPGSGAYTNDSSSTSQNRIKIVNGGIDSIVPASGGNNYNAVKVVIVGDGSGALASANVSGNSVQSVITITNPGSGYSWARAYFIPCIDSSSGGAVFQAIMAPRNGHGYNLARELGSNALIFNIRTTATTTPDDYFLYGEQSKFRQLGIISDLREFSNTDPSNIMAYKNFYIGPSHPKYNVTTLNRISRHYGEIIYMSNFPAIERNSGQEENIRIVIIF